jgi:hypothetical protein
VNGIADPFNGHIDEFRISQARLQRQRPKSTKAEPPPVPCADVIG